MYETYLIKEDDTINSIANKFNTSPEIIYQLNGYDVLIKKDNSIIVPKISSNYFDYYTITKGDTLYKIAKDNNLDSKLLAQLNGINESDYIYPNQVLLIPKGGTILYFTAIGDTLQEVANGLNISPLELMKQNNKIYLSPEQLIIYKYK